jgi:hypothetical protein
MKSIQLSVQTFKIDDFYPLGDIRIFWNDYGSKWWEWTYSPDGDYRGTWMWVKWFAPPVRMYDGKLPQPPTSDEWCMILVRTWYSSSDDAILNPMNLNKQPYVVLYGGWDYKPGTTEPGGGWFDGVISTPPDSTSLLSSGMLMGSGVGLFADKAVTRVNPITHKKEPWILPPSGPHHINWSTTMWLEPKDPYNDVDQNYYLLKREGWIEDKDKKNRDAIPPGWNPPKINFGGTPRQPPPYKPPTPPPLNFRRSK